MSASPFTWFLDGQGFVVLDGGLATALEAAGHSVETSLWSARVLLDDPDAVRAVHRSYLDAGADCISTAGYQASFESLGAVGMGRREAEGVLRLAVEVAVEAKQAFWSEPGNREGRFEPIVAASAGPYGASLADGSEYDGRYGVDTAVLERFHADRLEVLADTSADVVAFETIPSLVEAEVLAGLLASRPGTPAWLTFSCRDANALWDGTPITEAISALADVDSLVGVGVNCTAPPYIADLVDSIARTTDLPIIVYPNSGELYDPMSHAWTGPAEAWMGQVASWVDGGASVLGGCCRVGPKEIRELRRRLEAVHAL